MAASKDYEIVRYRADFEDEVLAMLRDTCSPDRDLNAAYMHWKYWANPYLTEEPPLIFVAMHRGRPVGMRGLHGSRWQTGSDGETCLLPCFGDSYVDPEHRSFRLFREITRAAFAALRERDLAYVLNLSARPATFMASRLMGWKALPSFGTLQWVSARRASRRGLLRFAKRQPLLSSLATRIHQRKRDKRLVTAATENNPFHTLDRRGAGGEFDPSGRITVAKKPSPEEMATLAARLESHRPIRHLRDPDFFAWRFEKPLALHRFLFWRDPALEGYMVLQTALYAGFLQHRILELRGTSPEVKQGLLQAARDRGGFTDLVTWSASLPEEEQAMFRAAGFRPMDESAGVKGYRFALMIRAIDVDAPPDRWILGGRPLLDFANWDVRMVDSDAY